MDIIVGLDGKTFPSAGSIWAVFLEAARAGKPVTLTVRRGDATLSFVVQPHLARLPSSGSAGNQ